MSTNLIKNLKCYLFLSFFLVFLFSCKDDDGSVTVEQELVQQEDATVPLTWMGLFLEIDRFTQDFRPGPTSRVLAYINLAAYESVMTGMPEYNSIENLFSGLNIPKPENDDLHFPTVLNAVYANLMKRFVPTNYILPSDQSRLQLELLAVENNFNEMFRMEIGTAKFERSVNHGLQVANAVWDWAKSDAFGHNAHENARPTGYNPPTGPGLWTPTTPDLNIALFPYWGNARTFAISATQKLAKDPLNFSEEETSPFYAQAFELRNIGNNLEFNDQWVTEFWNDEEVGLTFSPVARWISITNQLIKEKDTDLETALYTYVKLSIALNDAGVGAWHSKYHFNVERPLSYINRVVDADWQPYFESVPSCPSYPSSHAAFGAAAAEILSHIYGYNSSFSDDSHSERTEFLGMSRHYDTFYLMAEECAISRLNAGMNFRMDIDEGLRMGFEIGRTVNEIPFK